MYNIEYKKSNYNTQHNKNEKITKFLVAHVLVSYSNAADGAVMLSGRQKPTGSLKPTTNGTV